MSQWRPTCRSSSPCGPPPPLRRGRACSPPSRTRFRWRSAPGNLARTAPPPRLRWSPIRAPRRSPAPAPAAGRRSSSAVRRRPRMRPRTCSCGARRPSTGGFAASCSRIASCARRWSRTIARTCWPSRAPDRCGPARAARRPSTGCARSCPSSAPDQVLYALLSQRGGRVRRARALPARRSAEPARLASAAAARRVRVRRPEPALAQLRLHRLPPAGRARRRARLPRGDGDDPARRGRPHRATASLFARRRDRLSLVFHGNDHVKHELLRPSDAGRRARHGGPGGAADRALRARSGLPVDRVMMPPHGLCSQHDGARARRRRLRRAVRDPPAAVDGAARPPIRRSPAGGRPSSSAAARSIPRIPLVLARARSRCARSSTTRS